MDYSYKDPYLSTLVSQMNEDTAIADLLALGDFKQADLDTLVPYRSYILCCIDNMKAPDDVFSIKKKAYEREFSDALILARTKDKVGVTRSIFSVGIERA